MNCLLLIDNLLMLHALLHYRCGSTYWVTAYTNKTELSPNVNVDYASRHSHEYVFMLVEEADVATANFMRWGNCLKCIVCKRSFMGFVILLY